MNLTAQRYDWTYSEYARLPDDGNRYEVLDGELLVSPSPGPPHQRIAARLFLHSRNMSRLRESARCCGTWTCSS
jgi:Uma2 family endonuclease